MNYHFYDAERTYLGAATIFRVTSANVHADTWEEHPGTFVTIPAGAAFYRLWDASGTFPERSEPGLLTTAEQNGRGRYVRKESFRCG